jgi:uncharacterized protein YecE (DUF72 family)
MVLIIVRVLLLVEILIGAGGWDYFNVPGDKLRSYAKAFRTVEVNSTYYTIPPLSMVRSWRKRVPDTFEFTVRCNRELMNKLKSDTLDSSLKVFDRMKQICLVLKAGILHIQIPSTHGLEKESIEKIEEFLSTASLSDLRLTWEIRAPSGEGRRRLLGVLEELDMIHCVDLSRETPAYESDTIYSRLFGKGAHNIYQFSDVDLKEIDRTVKSSKAEKAFLNFHGTRMYKDAARISVYEATGNFPKVTRGIGVDSVIEVLSEDARFPANTSELVKHQGWKVVEWKDNQQLRLSDLLSRIEERRFENLSEVKTVLQKL